MTRQQIRNEIKCTSSLAGEMQLVTKTINQTSNLPEKNASHHWKTPPTSRTFAGEASFTAALYQLLWFKNRSVSLFCTFTRLLATDEGGAAVKISYNEPCAYHCRESWKLRYWFDKHSLRWRLLTSWKINSFNLTN